VLGDATPGILSKSAQAAENKGKQIDKKLQER
jgi:hypothetical protein